ncbi:MAG: DUF4388 domain-containing protein [Microthrixaceae bacterium]
MSQTTLLPADAGLGSAVTLSGAVEDLSVIEVLTLLEARRHTGRLSLGDESPLWLWIDDGAVVAGGGGSPLAPARHLLAGGHIVAEEVESVFDLLRRRHGDRVVDHVDPFEVIGALDAVVAQPVLATTLAALAVSAASEMLLVRSGTLTFAEAVSPPFAVRYRTPLVVVLESAASMVERWALVRSRVGDDSVVLRRVRRVRADCAPLSFSAIEWAALNEVGSNVTVGQVARRLGLGRFDCYSLLGSLLERGLVERDR